MSLLYISNLCFVGLKQAIALMFASKFTYKTFIATYMTSAVSSIAHAETELHNKKVEYYNSDVGNVCNSLYLCQHSKTQQKSV